jgi:dihydrofolate synthase/folylpolyglutamate synthase
MAAKSLASWLDRLESLHPEEIELGLERVSAVAHSLGLLPFPATVVTVAGTNGKGTTVAVLSALLQRAGRSCCVYTSPHLLRYNERVRMGGQLASDSQLVAAFEAIDRARGDISLTYFEFGTLAALYLFHRARADVVILEVGLGGRLDAVNLVDPDIAVITSVALDHESWLGDDREQIGYEKAGILRAGIPLVVADLDPPLSVRSRAAELACDSWYVGEDDLRIAAGSSQRPENVAAARRVAHLLGVDVEDSELSGLLADCGPAGRLQQLEIGGHPIVLDVAHNPAACDNLATFLAGNPVPGRTFALFAALSDKKIHAMIRSCQKQVDGWCVTGLPGVGRALPVSELADELRRCGVHINSEHNDPAAAWHSAKNSLRTGDRLVVFGSFYTVAAILPLLGE